MSSKILVGSNTERRETGQLQTLSVHSGASWTRLALMRVFTLSMKENYQDVRFARTDLVDYMVQKVALKNELNFLETYSE